MALGFNRQAKLLNAGDSAELTAYIYDPEDSPYSDDDILDVQFTILKPDGSRTVESGEVQEDGGAFFRYTDTDLEGEYRVVAQFTFTDGSVKSTRSDFEVQDPLSAPIDPTVDPEGAVLQAVSNHVWDHLEDLFDSEDGGPWLRDMTLNVFSPKKIKDFIPEALFTINYYNPPTELTAMNFAGTDQPLLVDGTLVMVIRHLMRSYTEQPNPVGGQITFEDRRDYLQRWGTIYQIEYEHFDKMLKLWKRQFLGLGQSKVLVSSKAGRLLPAPLRSRNIGRGYY